MDIGDTTKKIKLKKKITQERYFIIIQEWNYPNESGREVHNITYDDKEEAESASKLICEEELDNFRKNCYLEDTLPVGLYESTNYRGHIITTKSGLDEWWFATKIISINHGTL